MRARKKVWAEREIASNKSLIADPAALKGKWHTLFQNDHPIHIEIGCGKGQFINQNALRHAEINYIAIEREEMIIVMAAKLARETGGNGNIVFITDDAKALTEYFEPGEISRIYINFCDPWHRKKKWAKRRLTHRGFLSKYQQLLQGGDVFFKTDNRKLFEFSLNEFAETGWRLQNIALDLHHSAYQRTGDIMTEYEEKFSAMGLPIYRLEAIAPMDTP
ncbi:MAG: tRNA (guanosine(46)-N7)-methyltransferase TrmB [Clostridiales bacterium]|jgi:tRNA (guanine-N7-)-methyltransferase|nr:tRNA (guanosine(46)-N7)-methyltransferase TrmB [Clostridiales bacterium]